MSSLHALFGSSIPPSVDLGRSFKQDQQRLALRFDGPIQISEGKSEKKLGLGLGETGKEVMELEGRVLVPTYARAPVVLERGEGCKLYDINGREYLDMTAGIAVNSLGHGDPDWVKAVVEQARTLTHVSNVYYSIPQVSVGQAIYLTGSLFNQSCRPNIHAYFLSRKLFIRSTEFVAEACPLELSYGPQVGQWDIYYRQQLLEDQYSFKCHCSGCSEQNLSDLVIHAFRCVNPDCFGAVLPCHTILHEKLDDNCLQKVPAINILDRPMPVQKQEREAISEVAHLLLEHTSGILKIGPGYCLSCGTHCDLEASHATVRKAGTAIKRLQDKLILKKVSTTVLSDALKSLTLLKSVMHAYSKDIAQAEDNLAEAFCLIGEFQAAVHHCKASLEIIKRLYPTSHIVIGNELMKLASIQLSLNDRASALNSIKQAYTIFSLHYGSHMVMLFPYLENLQREAKKVLL